MERRSKPPDRVCVIISESVAEAAALHAAVIDLVSTVRLATPSDISEELWNSAVPRIVVGRAAEGVSACLPWIALLQSLPNTGTLALLDADPIAILATLQHFDAWLPARTPEAIVAQQVQAMFLLLERQARLSGPNHIHGQNLVIDMGREEATTADGEHIPLTPSEFRLLSVLASQPGRVVGFDNLGVALPGHFLEAGDAYHSVKVHIGRLRQKLETWTGWTNHILSARNRGFLFERRLNFSTSNIEDVADELDA
jgi:DNA-binding winged helix-turn-helix (wHTH) protein